MRNIICITAASVFGFTPLAYAATANVIFNGTVAATCVLTVQSNGTMTASSDLTSLSSKNPGGVAGTVRLITTGGVNLSVDPGASSVTRPAGDTGTITWTPVYSSAGSHVLTESGSSRALTTAGISTVSVNLTGTKGPTDSFAVGAYQATVTVRCEP